MNKHYIRLEENSDTILLGYSDAFYAAVEGDICINENGQRHFEMLGITNPSLVNENNSFLYKYSDGEIIETSEEERSLCVIVVELPDPNLTDSERIDRLEMILLEREGII